MLSASMTLRRTRAIARSLAIVARVEDGVDREVELLERREQQLGLAAGERDGRRERAEREQRLVAVAALGLECAGRVRRS